MRILRRALIAGTAAFLIGCSSSTGPEGSGLEGYWDWVRSFGGIAGTEVTPASAGYTMAIELAGDQMIVYRDGAVRSRTTIEVRTDAAGLTGTIAYADPVFGWPEQTFELQDRNTLLLADGCCDGFVYTFVRRSKP